MPPLSSGLLGNLGSFVEVCRREPSRRRNQAANITALDQSSLLFNGSGMSVKNGSGEFPGDIPLVIYPEPSFAASSYVAKNV